MSTHDPLHNGTRYWCHPCNAEVPIYMAPDPTCQQCKQQFIEEIDMGDDPRNFLADVDDDYDASSEGIRGPRLTRQDSASAHDVFSLFAQSTGLGDHDNNMSTTAGQSWGPILQNILSMLSTNMDTQHATSQPTFTRTNDPFSEHDDPENASDMEHTDDPQRPQRRQPMLFYGGMVDGNVEFRPMQMPDPQLGETHPFPDTISDWFGLRQPLDSQHEPQRQQQQAQTDNGPDFGGLFQLLSALAGTPLDSGFVGNPSDYVFSQAALDNVISQLMEQSGPHAPPPAPDEVIDALLKRTLTQDEQLRQLDCAVCKDEFAASEYVIELPCVHVFHEDCIKPWLKVNGTCPVCRHSVLPEKESQSPSGDTIGNSRRTPPQRSSRLPEPSTAETVDPARANATPSWAQENDQPSSTLPATWPTDIPRAFTWGPGGQARSPSEATGSGAYDTHSPSSRNSDHHNRHLHHPHHQQPSSSSRIRADTSGTKDQDSLNLDLD